MSEEKHKLVPDEQTLAKLLEAAYVVQEHNREVQRRELRNSLTHDRLEAEDRAHPSLQAESPEPALPDNTSTLGKIVEIQRQIQLRRLDFESALKLVAERIVELSRAAGAAIGIVEGKSVRYRAVSGFSTPVAGSIVPLDKSLFAPCLKTAQVFRCPDASSQPHLDVDECKRRGIRSLIAVPVFHDGGVAGGLELYFASTGAFAEPDVDTCQLMAGLVAEALVRVEEAAWKKSLANERAAMLEALEKLQPNLAALVENSPRRAIPAESRPTASRASCCRKCGHQLMAEEQFCGRCGTARAGDYEPPNMQSKVASLWQMQELQKKEPDPESSWNAPAKSSPKHDSPRPDSSLARVLEEQVPELFGSDDLEFSEENSETAGIPAPVSTQEITVEDEDLTDSPNAISRESLDAPESTPKAQLTHSVDWSSAASARAFLENLTSNKRARSLLQLWNAHRGDIYLGIAVLLVACVVRWGILANRPVKEKATPTAASAAVRKPAPEAGLSFFDRALIQLGLAEPPDPVKDKGNPRVEVWVDLHTALYYCPGTDLYGKTPQGKFTTQREAQLDQFEPAYRKACD